MKKTVVVLVEDLFWRAKIDHAVRSAQSEVVFLSDPAELASAADPETVGAVFVDLSIKKDPFPGISALKANGRTKGIPVVGFFEHVRKDLQEKAQNAGCNKVLPRSAFAEKLADIVLEYALPGSVRTESEESELPEE
jgi:CheY-like chemotaxis protein